MYIEDEAIKIYFRYADSGKILKNEIQYHKFPRGEFQDLMFCRLKEYSETEAALLYQHMQNRTVENVLAGGNFLNVFAALTETAGKLLVLRANEIRCQYTQLQRWRSLTTYIGEDLPICCFLAQKNGESGRAWSYFEWETNIGHTNEALNKIMNEKISDNHFHLFGSAPVFQLIWIKLMNNVNTNQFMRGFRQMDQKRRSERFILHAGQTEPSFACMALQATLIRALLFAYVSENIWVQNRYGWLVQYLSEDERILDVQKDIRECINNLKAQAMEQYGVCHTDYANDTEVSDSPNVYFSGERKLIYQLLYELLVRKCLPDEIANLLYAYLVLYSVLRAELVQVNENIGFENFSVYQKRKKYFLGANIDMEHMIRCAVESSFRPGNLKSLEIRISPEKNYVENVHQIDYYDEVIKRGNLVPKEAYYYVYHFPKQKDTWEKPEGYLTDIPCRDAALRKKVRKWTKGICLLRERAPQIAARVRGVDACSQEIDCRPEVFAVAFRKLQNHVVAFGDEDSPKQLKQTYHAGEDFLDIVDGLRALDEAIHFFNMRNGDRFGHATVLGIDAQKWYETKHYHVVMPIQDYLDNVVWLYHKLLEYQIDTCEPLKSYLRQQYEEYFNRIYGSVPLNASIYSYYDAWKLRGDEPQLYGSGGYEENGERLYLMPEWKNTEFPEEQEIRRKPEIGRLYYYYHFSWEVRTAGKIAREFEVPRMYVEAVEKIQKGMQKEIGERGIAIETNPSSNLKISTIGTYGEHPIVNLYNLGLTAAGATDCPQLCVSVNTDDKGVFNTSLENEYALMASALENIRGVDGKHVYNRQEVYDWINRIRVMGNRQTF